MSFLDDLRPLAEEAIAFRETLSPESDRGCALMAAAFLDARLKTLIARKLVDEPQAVKRFLEFNGAAGTFSSRIDFCYLTGLLPKSVHRDLHMIRKIRNEFGHRVETISFEDQEFRSRCESRQNSNVPEDASSRQKFSNTCYGVLSVIDAAIVCADSFHSPPENVLTKEDKEKSHLDFLKKFKAAVDKLSPKEYCTPEGKAKIFDEVTDGIFGQIKNNGEIDQDGND